MNEYDKISNYEGFYGWFSKDDDTPKPSKLVEATRKPPKYKSKKQFIKKYPRTWSIETKTTKKEEVDFMDKFMDIKYL